LGTGNLKNRDGFVRYAPGVREVLNQGDPIIVSRFLPMYDYRLDEEIQSNFMRQWASGKIKVEQPANAAANSRTSYDVTASTLDMFMCSPQNTHISWQSRYMNGSDKGNDNNSIRKTMFVDEDTDIPYYNDRFYNVGGEVNAAGTEFTKEKLYFYHTNEVVDTVVMPDVTSPVNVLLAHQTKANKGFGDISAMDNSNAGDGIWQMGGTPTKLEVMRLIGNDSAISSKTGKKHCYLLNRNVYRRATNATVISTKDSPSQQNKCEVATNIAGTNIPLGTSANSTISVNNGTKQGNQYLQSILTSGTREPGGIPHVSNQHADKLYNEIYVTKSTIDIDGSDTVKESRDSMEYRLTIRRHFSANFPVKERKKINKIVLFYQLVKFNMEKKKWEGVGDYIPYATIVFPTVLIGEGGVDAVSVRFTNLISECSVQNVHLDVDNWMKTYFEENIITRQFRDNPEADYENEVVRYRRPVLHSRDPLTIGLCLPTSQDDVISGFSTIAKINVAMANISDYIPKLEKTASSENSNWEQTVDRLTEIENAVFRIVDIRKTAYQSNNNKTTLEWLYHSQYNVEELQGNGDIWNDKENKEKPSATVWKITNTQNNYTPVSISPWTLWVNPQDSEGDPSRITRFPLQWKTTEAPENTTKTHSTYHYFMLGPLRKGVGFVDYYRDTLYSESLFGGSSLEPAFWLDVALIRTQGVYTGLISTGPSGTENLNLVSIGGKIMARGEAVTIGIWEIDTFNIMTQDISYNKEIIGLEVTNDYLMLTHPHIWMINPNAETSDGGVMLNGFGSLELSHAGVLYPKLTMGCKHLDGEIDEVEIHGQTTEDNYFRLTSSQLHGQTTDTKYFYVNPYGVRGQLQSDTFFHVSPSIFLGQVTSAKYFRLDYSKFQGQTSITNYFKLTSSDGLHIKKSNLEYIDVDYFQVQGQTEDTKYFKLDYFQVHGQTSSTNYFALSSSGAHGQVTNSSYFLLNPSRVHGYTASYKYFVLDSSDGLDIKKSDVEYISVNYSQIHGQTDSDNYFTLSSSGLHIKKSNLEYISVSYQSKEGTFVPELKLTGVCKDKSTGWVLLSSDRIYGEASDNWFILNSNIIQGQTSSDKWFMLNYAQLYGQKVDDKGLVSSFKLNPSTGLQIKESDLEYINVGCGAITTIPHSQGHKRRMPELKLTGLHIVENSMRNSTSTEWVALSSYFIEFGETSSDGTTETVRLYSSDISKLHVYSSDISKLHDLVGNLTDAQVEKLHKYATTP